MKLVQWSHLLGICPYSFDFENEGATTYRANAAGKVAVIGDQGSKQPRVRRNPLAETLESRLLLSKCAIAGNTLIVDYTDKSHIAIHVSITNGANNTFVTAGSVECFRGNPADFIGVDITGTGGNDIIT